MATLPTPEESAREILNIFVNQCNRRAGEVLRINNFQRGLRGEDFTAGIEVAKTSGWIEVLEGGVSFKLTDAGFAAA